ncbi:MAG TPA: recombinase RecA, partial [Gemmata sp.]
MSTKNEVPSPIGVIPTGSYFLDRALGIGGWPRGRIVELYGSHGSGRTTLALEAIGQAQRAGGTGALLDADHATEPDTARRLGVEPGSLLLHRTNVLEDAFEQIETWIATGADVIVLDSIAALMRESVMNRNRSDRPDEGEDKEHQRIVEHSLRRVLGRLYSSRSVLLVTNQLREKLGVMYGDPMTTPWETHPLRDYASVRADVKRVTHVKEGETTIGTETRVKIVKNRFGGAFRDAEFEIWFDSGICREAELLELGSQVGVVRTEQKDAFSLRGPSVFEG